MKSARLHLAYFAIGLLPQTRGFALKRVLLRWAGLAVGDGARICSSARFYSSGPIVIGARVWVGHDVGVYGGDAEIRIGDDVDGRRASPGQGHVSESFIRRWRDRCR